MEGDEAPLGDAGPPGAGDQHAAAVAGRGVSRTRAGGLVNWELGLLAIER